MPSAESAAQPHQMPPASRRQVGLSGPAPDRILPWPEDGSAPPASAPSRHPAPPQTAPSPQTHTPNRPAHRYTATAPPYAAPAPQPHGTPPTRTPPPHD